MNEFGDLRNPFLRPSINVGIVQIRPTDPKHALFSAEVEECEYLFLCTNVLEVYIGAWN